MAFSNVMKIPVRNNKWSEMNGKLSIPLLLCLLPVGVVAQQPHINSADSVRSLGEVIVTGSRTPRPVNSSPVTTQLLSGKVMRDAGFGDFQSALQHLTPGLNVQKVAFGSEMSMDGMDARHVVMLQDGERMTGDMAGNLDYERFNIHGIDRVEVVKGASSTLYGSRASGAVINVIGKKTHKPLDIDVGVRWGQMNERNYRNPKKKDFIYMFEKNADRPNLSAWLSAGAHQSWFTSQTDVWYSSTDAFYLYQKVGDRKVYSREANPWLHKDTVLQSTFPRPPMGIEGREHIVASQKLWVEPMAELSVQLYGSCFFMNSYDLVQDLVFTQARDWTYGLKASYRWKDYLTAKLMLHTDRYASFKRHERRDERKPVYKSRILQPRLTLQSRYFDGHELNAGIELFDDVLTSDRFVNHKVTTRTLSEMEWFVQDDWSPTQQWTVSAGLRTNYSRVFGLIWLPKVAVKWQPDTHWALRAVYSKGSRSPSIKELFFNWDHLGMFVIRGNENLQPEKNHYLSLGVEYASPKLFVNANGYANLYRDKIEGVWKIYDMQYNFLYTNLARQTVAGLDVLARWKPWTWLTLDANYSYVYITAEKGRRFSTTSPHAATANATYKYSRRGYNLGVTLSAQIMGEKRYDVQDRLFLPSEGRGRDAYFRCTLPAYALCNLNVAQTFSDKYRLSVGVNNLLNYKPKTLGSGLTTFSVPAEAGARLYVQFEVKIDKK